MTNEEAINLLDNLIGMIADSQENDYDSALKMAIESLYMPRCRDCRNCKHYNLDLNASPCDKCCHNRASYFESKEREQ